MTMLVLARARNLVKKVPFKIVISWPFESKYRVQYMQCHWNSWSVEVRGKLRRLESCDGPRQRRAAADTAMHERNCRRSTAKVPKARLYKHAVMLRDEKKKETAMRIVAAAD